MNWRVLLIGVASLAAAIALSAGGYLLGASEAPSDADAAKTRAAAEARSLKRGRARNARALDAIRIDAGGPAARRGRRAGVAAGTLAGQEEIAARGAGPTQLPLPTLPIDAYSAPPNGFTERPTEIILTNHGGAEGITWSAWGETATGTGTFTGSDCDPSCAEGSPTRDPVTLTASDPQFTPENKRFYTKLVVAPQGKPSFTVKINPLTAPSIE